MKRRNVVAQSVTASRGGDQEEPAARRNEGQVGAQRKNRNVGVVRKVE